jgi:SAM-dependent methyltransferase
LRLTIYAVDMSREVLEFAERGVYSCRGDVTGDTFKDQKKSIFERLTDEEMEAMFEVEDDLVKVRPRLKEGIIWLRGDAGDPELIGVLGYQDIVVANRFLCHMKPMAAERCLRNIARLVKPGGYLFVSRVDLDVRTKVARAMGWKPVTDLLREIHEGDPSLREGWPLAICSLEPFRDNSPDWKNSLCFSMTSIIEACRRSKNGWPSGQRRGYGNAYRLRGVAAFCLSGRNNVRVRAPMAAGRKVKRVPVPLAKRG